MAQLKIETWELSNLVPKEDIPLSEGEHTLYIESASFNPDEQIYSIRFVSLTNENEVSTLKYYLKTQDNTAYSNTTVGTLNSLTRAVAGPDKSGILSPTTLIQCLVKADVKMSKPKEYNGVTRQFPGIYEFKPVSATEYEIAKSYGYELKDQYVKE